MEVIKSEIISPTEGFEMTVLSEEDSVWKDKLEELFANEQTLRKKQLKELISIALTSEHHRQMLHSIEAIAFERFEKYFSDFMSVLVKLVALKRTKPTLALKKRLESELETLEFALDAFQRTWLFQVKFTADALSPSCKLSLRQSLYKQFQAEIDQLAVQRRALFPSIYDTLLVLKGADGELQQWKDDDEEMSAKLSFSSTVGISGADNPILPQPTPKVSTNVSPVAPVATQVLEKLLAVVTGPPKEPINNPGALTQPAGAQQAWPYGQHAAKRPISKVEVKNEPKDIKKTKKTRYNEECNSTLDHLLFPKLSNIQESEAFRQFKLYYMLKYCSQMPGRNSYASVYQFLVPLSLLCESLCKVLDKNEPDSKRKSKKVQWRDQEVKEEECSVGVQTQAWTVELRDSNKQECEADEQVAEILCGFQNWPDANNAASCGAFVVALNYGWSGLGWRKSVSNI